MLVNLNLISKYRGALMGIAILCVMLFHLQIFQFGYGGVDIFLFLSGFGLYYSLSRKEIKLSQYYKKRFCRILPEYWLYLICIYILSMDFSLKSFLKMAYYATTIGYWIPNTPFISVGWYISCILFFYIIYPFYYRSFKKNGLRTGITAVCIGLTLIMIYALTMVVAFDNKNVGGLLILTIARIPIFFIGSITGYLTKEKQQVRISKSILFLVLFLFLASILLLFISIHYFSNSLWTCSLYFLPFIVITPIVCILIAMILDKLPKIISNLFFKIGTISLELYLVHVYLYHEYLCAISNIYGKGTGIITTIIISFISAIILYYVNKLVLQKLCKKIL